MEDFPLLILFFMIYLIASSSGKKKNKKNKGNPQQTRRTGTAQTHSRGEQHEVCAQAEDRIAQEGFRTAFEGRSDPERCDQKRMHLHEVTDEQMQLAAEGEDPCHAGGIQDTMDSQQEVLPEEGAQQPLGQDVLRGVIMSEILMRPDERRALQRSRRRTNGY